MNLRNDKPTELYDFKVDRTTPLGNRFNMQSEFDRNSVCIEYDNYFPTLIANKLPSIYFSQILSAYRKYGKVRLFCWCFPKRCHAETIKRTLEEWK